MDLEFPLVSIGIPTHNRPEGLRRALDCITKQSYKNLEIIVSDNCSDNEEVGKVINEFVARDNRIISIRQDRNIGISNNFNFVLTKATGGYFMWAADDDEWVGIDFLASLMKFASENVLTFPAAILKNEHGELSYPLTVYERCNTKIDYLKAFCSSPLGYPFYGVYNLKLFYSKGLAFRFDEDLVYYQEGTFLHKLILSGPVKYVADATILYDASSKRFSPPDLLDSFVKYFKRILQVYANTTEISVEEKSVLINL